MIKKYLKVLFFTLLFVMGGSVLITIMTAPVNPKDTNELGSLLAILWSFVVYIAYTLPHTEQLKADERETLEKKRNDSKDL